MNYLYVRNGVITSKGNLKNLTDGVINVEVSDEIFKNSEKYIYQNGEIVLNPNYEIEQAAYSKTIRAKEIKDELNKLDLKSIRAIRANEETKIAEFEAIAKNLRNELSNLNAKL